MACLTLFLLYVPEDAEDHNSCGERYEGNTVADGVANLHLPEKLALKRKKTSHSEGNWEQIRLKYKLTNNY